MDVHLNPGSIVCGVDGSTDAERALHWAAAQASLDGRPLAVVAASGVEPVTALSWAGAAGTLAISTTELVERVSTVAETAAASIRLEQPQLAVTAHAAHGDPGDILAMLSRHAHLLVVGGRGRGPLRSRVLGSVSTTVTRHAQCPVVVCRPESPGLVRRGVLVGVDGTQQSGPVLDFAFRAASQRDLPLTVLHASRDVPANGAGPRPVVPAHERREAERLLVAESLAGFTDTYPDVHVEIRLVKGSPDHCLTADPARWHLIVVGRHPTDSLRRMLSPTVATSVVERARTTVAVVPIPAPRG